MSVILGMLLTALDQTVVGTAMPRVIADLNGLQHYAWVATAYLLASAVSMPIWGKLSTPSGASASSSWEWRCSWSARLCVARAIP